VQLTKLVMVMLMVVVVVVVLEATTQGVLFTIELKCARM